MNALVVAGEGIKRHICSAKLCVSDADVEQPLRRNAAGVGSIVASSARTHDHWLIEVVIESGDSRNNHGPSVKECLSPATGVACSLQLSGRRTRKFAPA